jgi:hypothetical protein
MLVAHRRRCTGDMDGEDARLRDIHPLPHLGGPAIAAGLGVGDEQDRGRALLPGQQLGRVDDPGLR